MTRSEHIRESACIYDAELPPSVPPGRPLRESPAPRPGESHQRPRFRRSCTRAFASIRVRLAGD